MATCDCLQLCKQGQSIFISNDFPCLPACVPAHQCAYLLASVLTYLPTSVLPHLPSSVSTFLPISVFPSCMSVCLPTYMPDYLATCLPANLASPIDNSLFIRITFIICYLI